MICLKNGSKVKIKSTLTFFEEKIYQTKVGWIWVNPITGVENASFPSQHEAEDAILQSIKARNTSSSIWVHHRDHCIAMWQAFQKKELWDHPGDNERIYWFNEGGLAVAVKLDSLGKAVDYLSLDEWSNKFNWSLPEGDWHYFSSWLG